MPLLKRGSSTPVLPAAEAMPTAAQEPQAQAPVEKAAPEAVKPEPAKPAYTGRKTSTDTMSKEEWAAKDRRIGRAGLYQAALQSTGLMQYAPTLDDYFKLLRRAAEDGLAFVNEQA